jgi:hypothetical protein
MRKGFVLTLDVMAAILIAVVFTTSMMYFVTQPKLKTDEYLYMVSQDFLTVADRDGSLLSAVCGDADSINEFLDDIPANMCLNLTVVDEGANVVFDNSTGCGEPTRHVMGKRTIVNATQAYTARLRVWYR